MAPRVHNSGHWTLEGAVTSQFENHLRAILDLPLGSTRAVGFSAMLNLIGTLPARAALLGEPGLHLHDYGKQPRPGRKLGHCTLVEPTAGARDR
ncbi:5-(carboxyamino)imidazole ribonucleotide synthase, partial [Enterococcus faecium]|uniref:ATP-grasp domain-containing protein n=1 Tax=Enterococcus faecium TaxID=1352 RepID=UPI003F427FF2